MAPRQYKLPLAVLAFVTLLLVPWYFMGRKGTSTLLTAVPAWDKREAKREDPQRGGRDGLAEQQLSELQQLSEEPGSTPGKQHKTVVDVFDDVYKHNYWDDALTNSESLSGPGSSLYNTATVRTCIAEWIQKYHIKSFGDICGDAHWQAHISGFDKVEYFGYDASEVALARARKENKDRPNMSFQQMDLSQEVPPKVDAFMTRDVLQHLPLATAYHAVANVIASGTHYLLVSNYDHGDGDERRQNADVATGGFYMNNMYADPFDKLRLPRPLENCSNYDPGYNERERFNSYLLLIDISNL